MKLNLAKELAALEQMTDASLFTPLGHSMIRRHAHFRPVRRGHCSSGIFRLCARSPPSTMVPHRPGQLLAFRRTAHGLPLDLPSKGAMLFNTATGERHLVQIPTAVTLIRYSDDDRYLLAGGSHGFCVRDTCVSRHSSLRATSPLWRRRFIPTGAVCIYSF